ncbi:alpha/beta hydrolase fold domain-containing protein [Nocardia sp. R7R-8]|uniref:alpha/beta hydrolase fold domain-containing protein n=1 Tax=Nocardia sp. R7R-8 TaxID=3459304 RepID=UPI00403D882E
MTGTRAPSGDIRMRGRFSGELLFRVSKVIAGVLAPGFDTMEGLQKAIRKNRAQGPARPSKRLLRKLDFSEERRDGTLIFHAARRDGAPQKPVKLLYLHGGAFVLDLQSIQWNLVAGLLDQVDADVIIPIYPLGPEAQWRETTEFIKSLYLELVREHGAENIVLTGDSAGGGLSMLLALAMRDEGGPAPAALVLFSPIFDMGASGADQPALERRDPSLSINLVHNAHTLWAPDVSPEDPRISPLYADQRDLPPTLVFSGDREILHSDALRLKKINPDIDHRSYAEMAHVFPVGGTREGADAFAAAADFISAHAASGR